MSCNLLQSSSSIREASVENRSPWTMVEERLSKEPKEVHNEKKTDGAISSSNCQTEIGQEIVTPEACAGSFGNIVVENSSRVLFGNKTHHQYEGPVTVKQFVQGSEGTVIQEDEENNKGDDKSSVQNVDIKCKEIKTNFNQGPRSKCLDFLNRNRKILVCIFGLLLIIHVIVAVVFLVKRNKNAELSWLDESNTNGSLKIIERNAWLAELPKEELTPLSHPVPHVIVSHTVNPSCTTRGKCTSIVRFIQQYHTKNKGWSDIGYNFLIGGDGFVYEGRGWKSVGAHTKCWNSNSIGISFIGTFEDILPPKHQVEAAQLLIEEGVKNNYLAKDFKLFAQRQVSDKFARSPGEVFYENIKTWPHWSNQTPTNRKC